MRYCLILLTIMFPMQLTAGQLTVEQQARFDQLTRDLRCPVCQNETIASSQAPLAKDLRQEIIHFILEGKSDPDITAYLVERYGDFVLYNPPFKSTTYLLWIGPLLLLIITVFSVLLFIRKQQESS